MRMYDQLRSEIRHELHNRLRGIGNFVPGGVKYVGSSGPVHEGKKVGAADIAALAAAPARRLTGRMPDGIVPAVGYRAWRAQLTKEGWSLLALGQDESWEPKKRIEARCVKEQYGPASPSNPCGIFSPHPAPNFDCECGVWAFCTPDKLLSALDGYRPSVIGPVSLWGRVIECENGFRAQYAYPAELWLLDNALEELGWTYNVPLRTVER